MNPDDLLFDFLFPTVRHYRLRRRSC
jgi:hypothetical protein